jgi:hypothetical protein
VLEPDADSQNQERHQENGELKRLRNIYGKYCGNISVNRQKYTPGSLLLFMNFAVNKNDRWRAGSHCEDHRLHPAKMPIKWMVVVNDRQGINYLNCLFYTKWAIYTIWLTDNHSLK